MHDGHDHDHTEGHAAQSFDERAATWDDDAKVARAAHIARRIGEEVALTGDERLFEYGAGTGLVSEALRGAVGPITLADASEGMRVVAQAKVDDGRLAGARVWGLDLSSDSVPADEAFDLIVTSMVLHHVGRLEVTLRAFHELLEPGGHLCVVDLDAEDGSFHGEGAHVHNGFARGAFAGLLRDAGFADVRLSDCGTVDRDGAEFGLFLAVASR
ncbi:MAG TPA: class I SAM-dependent methyltransferase [Acidimicrobiales bacterium]|nr:class I SAM-dependent methyltransferase [Acidimicrobiales bacterium]